MKPSWEKSPKWAKWLGQDDDGSWWWYELKPSWMDSRYVSQDCRFKQATAAPRPKKGDLEKRP